MLCGIILTAAGAGLAVFKAPSWLVVHSQVHQADIGVILGGGGGSRLQKGLSLYERGMVKQLVLVDTKKEYWQNMLTRQCPKCAAEKKVIFIENSINTVTDAQLVLRHCMENGIKSILIVTDPYHTRRALITFTSQFKKSRIKLSVISSDDFTGKLSPNQQWWQDDRTRKVIWDELGKNIFLLVRKR